MTAAKERKRMEEVMKMLGSLLPWANIIAIVCIGTYVQSIADSIHSIESRLKGVERASKLQAEALAKLMKRKK